ncbi:MAG: hypothetical protein SO108_04285 [Bacilli bacterium]|nr:hypothetical protein [Bacilli bacterium]
MNGKVLKVVEYNLSFGATDCYINVYGVFRYKKNNNLYIIYSDVDPSYSYVSYGSSYIKNNSILSLATNKKEEEEIIKEYIFKTIHQEPLEGFEHISLDNIEGIEIIGSNKIEVKEEVLKSLIALTIPKPKEEEKPVEEPKKKKSHKMLVLFFILLIGGGGYFFVNRNNIPFLPMENNQTAKIFSCTKEYPSNTLDATIKEENTYHFSLQEELEYVEEIKQYQFKTTDAYQEFIQEGTFNQYVDSEEKNVSISHDEQKNIFQTSLKVTIDSSYNKPQNYEDALSYEKENGYTCQESLGK